LEALKIIVDLGSSGGWIVVRVLIKFEAGSVDDVVMVGPGWVGDPNQGGKLLVDEFESNSK
jgi:hypothetical protein